MEPRLSLTGNYPVITSKGVVAGFLRLGNIF
jgi:hypothetical protein